MLAFPSAPRGARRRMLTAAASAAALAALGSAGLASSAYATDYCVGVSAGCAGTTYPYTGPGLQNALTTAASTAATDRVVIAAGTITSAATLTYNSAFPVAISGAGIGATTLEFTNTTVGGLLLEGGPGSTVADLRLTLKATTETNVNILVAANGVVASRLAVTDASTSDQTTAVDLLDGAEFADGSITNNSKGDVAVGSYFETGNVTGTTIDAGGGAGVSVGGPEFHLLYRSRVVNASPAVYAEGSILGVRDSLIDLGVASGAKGVIGAGAGVSIDLTRSTVVGTGVDQIGAQLSGSGAMKLALRDSVVDAEGSGALDLRCEVLGSGSAAWSTTTSSFATASAGNCSARTDTGPVDRAARGPQFVDPAHGDYRLLATSPLIDAGSSLIAASALDLAGAPRQADGDNNGTATNDIGAFEYQYVAPTLATPAPTPSPQTTPVPPVRPAPTATLTKPVAAFVRGKGGFALTAKASRRAVAVRLTNATAIDVTVSRLTVGHRGPKKACVAGAGKGRCTISTALKGHATLAVSAPTTYLVFKGTIGGKHLRPGAYRITVTPLGDGGLHGAAVSVDVKLA